MGFILKYNNERVRTVQCEMIFVLVYQSFVDASTQQGAAKANPEEIWNTSNTYL